MSLAVWPLHYFFWHYTLALGDLWRMGSGFLLFTFHFFSVPVLIRTWVAPWRRLNESYASGFDPGAWFSTLIVNLLMRLVGFCLRTLMIVTGIVALALVLGIWVLSFVLWMFLPFLWMGLVVVALRLILGL